MQVFFHLRLLTVCAAAALAVMPHTALSNEYYVKPRLSVGSEYSDNRFLNVQNPRSVMSYNQQVSADIGGKSEVFDFFFEPSVQKSEFDQVPILNAQNIYLRGNGDYKTENNQFSLDATRSNDTTLTNERDLFGFSSVQEKRVTDELNPSWTIFLSERFSIQLSESESSVKYPNVNRYDANLVEYTNRMQSASVIYQLSEKAKIYIEPYQTQFNSSSILDRKFDTTAFEIGGGYTPSESDSFTFNFGKTKSELQERYLGYLAYEKEELGSVFELKLKHIGETLSILGAISQSLTPTASGLINKTDEMDFDIAKSLSDRTSADVMVNAWRFRSVGNLDEVDARDQARMRFTYSWAVAPKFSLAVAYDYQWQKFLNAKDSADTNTVLFSIIYVSEHYF